MTTPDAPPPAPRANPDLFGHAAAEASLRDAALSGRLHHAWLIGGPEGIGKATLAFRFARALLADFPGDGLVVGRDAPVFRRVANGTHADLAVLARSWDDKRKRLRGEILADEVRGIGDFLALTPAEGGWRIVIVDGAEHLNRAASNALLKLLEEPPARSILLLASAAPGRLLPTVRSRCRSLPLRRLGESTLRRALARLRPDLDADTVAALAAGGDGSPGRALQAASEDAAVAEAADEALRRADARRGEPTASREDEALAEQLGRSEDGFETFATALQRALETRARCLVRARTGGLAAAAAAAEASTALGALRERTARLNLDKRQALLSALETIRTR